ncbi:MAG: mechanosensitive ion channel protein MscL [Verrucomicrobiales bacterium]|nr:mechanosensitive ion channel protein MscL [Verrucomicrobiales bacterium]
MLSEFKQFILKGDVVSLSTGVLIGAAFGKVVDGFTGGIVKPLLGAMGGDPNISLKAGIFDLGMVINAIIAFLITAAVIFFVIVKPYNMLMARVKRDAPAPAPAAPSAEVLLLTEIRDSLKNR